MPVLNRMQRIHTSRHVTRSSTEKPSIGTPIDAGHIVILPGICAMEGKGGRFSTMGRSHPNLHMLSMRNSKVFPIGTKLQGIHMLLEVKVMKDDSLGEIYKQSMTVCVQSATQEEGTKTNPHQRKQEHDHLEIMPSVRCFFYSRMEE